MEKKRLEAKERDKDRQFQLEKERMELEQKRIFISMEQKITVERLQVQKKKVEAEEKIAIMKEKDKMTVKLPKLDPTKFDGYILKQTEFQDVFEGAIHNNTGLYVVDKFNNYLKS